MHRIMFEMWGFDGAKYIGRSLTLFRDPKAPWAGVEVGGIRISHMSDVPKEDNRMVLTISKNRRVEYRVLRLVVEEARSAPKETEPTIDLESVAGKIAHATVETIESVAADVKTETKNWPRADKKNASDLIKARRELLGAE